MNKYVNADYFKCIGIAGIYLIVSILVVFFCISATTYVNRISYTASGQEILRAHFENSDTITVGTPAGYNSNADQTWSRGTYMTYTTTNNQAPGSYVLHMASDNGTKTATIDVDADKDSGTIIINIYSVTESDYGDILRIDLATPDENNCIRIYDLSGSWVLRYVGGGSAETVSATHSSNTWETITAKWRTSGSPTLSIQVDAGTPGTTANALPTLTGTLTQTILGKDYGSLERYYNDYYLYDTWQ